MFKSLPAAVVNVPPAAVAKLFGMMESARIYGRIFTAWGCAGLIGRGQLAFFSIEMQTTDLRC